jgi:molybdopterin molybdotransferase
LPGNPVSGLVCFLLFVRPALAVLAGKGPAHLAERAGRLVREFRHRGDRPTYFPCRLVDGPGSEADCPYLETLEWAGSADLRTVSGADGFAVFPAGEKDYASGEVVRFLPLGPAR